MALPLKTIEKNMLALGKNALVDTWPNFTKASKYFFFSILSSVEQASQCKTSAAFNAVENAVIFAFRVSVVHLCLFFTKFLDLIETFS